MVVAFNWALTSGFPTSPDTVPLAASNLFYLVEKDVQRLENGMQPGSVIDLDFIAHSRGATVVSDAMAALDSTTNPALIGSFKELTFLDPHPANIFDVNTSYATSGWTGELGYISFGGMLAFTLLANDPDPIIPPNVDQTDIYYQQTPVQTLLQNPDQSFPPSFFEKYLFNLQGDVNDITNQSPFPANLYNLTELGINVGHSEVWQWYTQDILPFLNDPDILNPNQPAPTDSILPGATGPSGSVPNPRGSLPAPPTGPRKSTKLLTRP